MKTASDLDDFARIAGHELVQREEMVEPPPPTLPDLVLPLDATPIVREAFSRSRVDNMETFREGILSLKSRMTEFRRNFAPVVTPRPQLFVRKAQWRRAEPDCPQEVLDGLAGTGEWISVDFPHYGGPIGRATTFYRSVIQLAPGLLSRERLFLCFRAADYRARVYLNGVYLCEHEGFFDPFEVDVTGVAHEGENVLLVQLENDAICRGNESWQMPEDGEKIYAATGLGWDEPGLGWHHCPPGMGLYQKVYFEARPALHLAELWVRPKPGHEEAEFHVVVRNSLRSKRKTTLKVSAFGRNFESVATDEVVFDDLPEAGAGLTRYRLSLSLPEFRAWSPETPWLYEAQVTLGEDQMTSCFGMRSFELREEGEEKGKFFLNGTGIRLRGANTMGHEQQCVLHGDAAQLEEDILIAKYAGLNFLRITQRPVQREIYEMCDELGMMVQTDLPLFGKMRWTQYSEGVRQAAAMERLIRGHASCILVSLINEPFPAAWGDSAHRHFTRNELDSFLRACEEIVRFENPDRQIKAKDGDYEPPSEGLPDNHCYCGWYAGHGLDLGKLHRGYWQPVKPGWSYACGEYGAEGLDPVDLMRRRYPQDWLPQGKEPWDPLRISHSQTGTIGGLWMDSFQTMEDWVRASQAHQAWVVRLMTRAFRRDRRMVSFALHLLIDAFPAGWMKAVVDCERNPKPAFFELQDALRPLLVDARSDRWGWYGGETYEAEIWICSDSHHVPTDLSLSFLFEVEGETIASGEIRAVISACDSQFQGRVKFNLPKVDKRHTGHLRAMLVDSRGEVLSETVEDVSIFPRQTQMKTIAVASLQDGRALQFLEEAGLASGKFHAGECIVSSHPNIFSEVQSRIEAGAILILLELSPGEYDFGGRQVSIQPAGYGERHFVSRETRHPLVAGFEPNDFRFWHDPQLDRVSPLLSHPIIADDCTPILATIQADWGKATQEAHACTEFRYGRGKLIICQVKLAGRMTTNPVAMNFAHRLMGLSNV